jgi:parallel beta-helix repeat protein
LFFSEQNCLEDNLVYSNVENGIWLWYSGNNALSRNILINNTYNFGVFGNNFDNFHNRIDLTNNVEGKPIYYIVGAKNEVFDDSKSVGALYLIDCVNVTVRNLDLSGNGQGIFCYNATGSHIQNLTASRNNYGVDLLSSHNNTIDNNYCEDNWVDIRLENSTSNTVKNNTLVSAEKGISLYEADSNHIEGNSIHNNTYGIRMSTSHSNQIFRNNFLLNIAQVDLVNSNQNIWDNGHEGNFWSDNSFSDSNRDGITDEAYAVAVVDRDRFPLSGLYHAFEVSYGTRRQEIGLMSNSTILDVAYDENDRAIVLTVEGSDETLGFCRARVPNSLVEPELDVIIDGGLADVTYSNYNVYDDGVCRFIYFEYRHSAHEIAIVNEFQLLSLGALLTALTIGLILFLRGNLENVNL